MPHRVLDTPEKLEWFPFPGHEARFEITRDGQVRSLSRLVNSPVAGGQRRIAGRDRKLSLVKGYLAIQIRENGIGKTVYIHRAIATLFVPNPRGKPHVNHIDGDKTNNCPTNLEWVTHAENMRHAADLGLMPAVPSSGPGAQSPAAKLDWPTVRNIRRLLASGHTQAEVAARFGVAKGTIGFIARNETWVE